jgi:hypothetical protein
VRLKAALTAIALSVIGTLARAGEVDLMKGQITHDGSYSTQIIAATNKTGMDVDTLWVECGFFRGPALLGVGKGYAENVKPGQTVYIEVSSNHADNADRSDCRLP